MEHLTRGNPLGKDNSAESNKNELSTTYYSSNDTPRYATKSARRLDFFYAIEWFGIAGVVCLVAFPFWEKYASKPLLPFSLLKNRTFCAGCAIAFLYFMAFYLSIQPYFYSYLLVVQRQQVTTAGQIVQSFSFTATIVSLLISSIIKWTKISVYKPFVCIGAVCYVGGIVVMLQVRNQNASTMQIIGTQLAVGIGGGIFNVATQLGIQASADKGSVGVATAIFMTAAELGGAAGSAISGTVWSRSVPAKLTEYLPEATKSLAQEIFNDINRAISYPVGGDERIAIDRAYQESMRTLLIIALCVAGPLIPLSFVMKNVPLVRPEKEIIEDSVVRDDVMAVEKKEIATTVAQVDTEESLTSSQEDSGEVDEVVVKEKETLS